MFDRLELLIGKENIEKISKINVLIVGIGGVGGTALEALVRSGVKNITIIDKDVFSESNLNRQILSTRDSIGLYKVDVGINRCKSINPDVNITGLKITEGVILPVPFGETSNTISSTVDSFCIQGNLTAACHLGEPLVKYFNLFLYLVSVSSTTKPSII